MTFFRHFIERPEFDVLIVTTSNQVDEFELPYTPIRTSLPRWWLRFTRTRLAPAFHGFSQLYGALFLKRKVIAEARLHQPAAVFTVAGSWDWTSLAAQKLARELDVPLIASFNDWFDYGTFPVPKPINRMIENRFRQLYRESDLALCTSDGMRETLGEHPNAYVWYPTGAPIPEEPTNYSPAVANQASPLKVFFGGSLGDWYGPMIESLVMECHQNHPLIQFKIFGSLETWSAEFDHWAREKEIFGGQLPFDELRAQATEADLLLLLMGFSEDCALVERTSFKTKFLDYLSFERPIAVWGPEGCSAVRVAREFGSAECVTSPDPEICGKAINALASDPSRRHELIANARKMYESRFHPEKIHQGLVANIWQTIAARHPTS